MDTRWPRWPRRQCSRVQTGPESRLRRGTRVAVATWEEIVLSKEENELITRVGPGTPMGNLMREYWLPALLSSELPKPASDSVGGMLLGEQLIALRRTEGRVGLLPHLCPHRGASLFYARNEGCGLRCVYHGWQ